MTPHRRIIEDALNLARRGEAVKAIALLENGLRNPDLSLEPKRLAMLARNAAIFCESTGDLEKTLAYYREALRLGGDDPPTLFGIADICVRLHDLENAKAYYKKCRELALAQGNNRWLEILENRAQYWK